MGTLYVVSTPIGNLDDVSIRALHTLFQVDLIACEDTRRTGALLKELRSRFGSLIPTVREPPLTRYDDRSEQPKTAELLSLLLSGQSVALVSDAGTPLISDPGYVLIREARKRYVPVVSVPGPSAAVTALSVSGMPADKFLFIGYPPEKQSHRMKLFSDLPAHTTVILYSAPHKLKKSLEDLGDVLGDTEIVILRELTKIHEEYFRGSISEALRYFVDPRGEFVILIYT